MGVERGKGDKLEEGKERGQKGESWAGQDQRSKKGGRGQGGKGKQETRPNVRGD